MRSGVLISVHTFANDPARGIFLLLLLAVLITLALILYLKRLAKIVTHQPPPFSWFSREAALLLNSALLITAMTTILLGTLYPLILDALQLGTISVGAPYFNRVMMPLLFILMLCMGAGVLLHWEKASFRLFSQQAAKKILLALVSALVLLWGVMGYVNPLALVTLTLSFWIIASLQKSLRFHPGLSFAHGGFAILVIGVMLEIMAGFFIQIN